MIDYHNKRFKVVSNSDNGEVPEAMIFTYQQQGNILSCSYAGGNIRQGHLLGVVSDNGEINMTYHQIDLTGRIKTGKCHSKPSVLVNGKIVLEESWEWISGNEGHGHSVLEEV